MHGWSFWWPVDGSPIQLNIQASHSPMTDLVPGIARLQRRDLLVKR